MATNPANGSFGSVSHDGTTLTIDIDPNSMGGIALTSGDDMIKCFWDGTQWVCNDLTFGPPPLGQESGSVQKSVKK